MFAADLHTHTRYSHGSGSVEENILAARAKGLSLLAITDHGPANLFYGVRTGRLPQLRREIDALNARYPELRTLMGIECNLTGEGECDLPKGCEGLFDLVILGYHKGVLPKNGTMLRFLAHALAGGKRPTAFAARATDYLLRAMERYPIAVISHPGEYVPVEIERLAKGAAAHGVLLEINAKHPTLTEEELLCAVEAGASFLVSSDAHSPAQVGDFTRALPLLREERILSRVVNRDAAALSEFLAQKRP